MRKAIQSRDMRAGLLACALSCLLPGSLAAQDDRSFGPPEGCETFLTVQMKECRVEHHYTCADTGDDRWRIVYDESGPEFLSHIDPQAQWIASYELPDMIETRTLVPAQEQSSVTELLESGRDSFDFTQQRAGGAIERVFGEDRIVERNVLIDGEVLHRTVFEVTYQRPDGTEIGRYTGSEYVSAKYRRFFAGRGKSEFGGVETAFDRSPIDFIHPGEPGFQAVAPLYECSMMMSALEVSQ